MRQLPARSEERVYRRHADHVYRFALALLQDPGEAEDVTRAVFARADRTFDGREPPRDLRSWMIDAAYESCRARSAPDAPGEGTPWGAKTCAQAVCVSKAADGVLSRREVRRYRAHLGQCVDCEDWARSLHLQRRAFRTLALEPAPDLRPLAAALG